MMLLELPGLWRAVPVPRQLVLAPAGVTRGSLHRAEIARPTQITHAASRGNEDHRWLSSQERLPMTLYQ
jgi:hypothetical protein